MNKREYLIYFAILAIKMHLNNIKAIKHNKILKNK